MGGAGGQIFSEFQFRKVKKSPNRVRILENISKFEEETVRLKGEVINLRINSGFIGEKVRILR